METGRRWGCIDVMRGQGVAEKCPSCLEAPYLGAFPRMYLSPKMRIIAFWGLHWGPPYLGQLPFREISRLRQVELEASIAKALATSLQEVEPTTADSGSPIRNLIGFRV